MKVGADRTTVTFETEPRDQAHWPLSGQTVEIVPWSAVLPNGEKVGELSGHLSRVQASYDPDARTLEAFALVAGAWTLAAAFQDGEDIRAAPFEALAFPLSTLWPD